MVTVRVKTFATLREMLSPSFEVKLGDDATVRGLLNEIFRKYGKHVGDRMIDPNTGELRSYFKVLKNGRNVEFLKGMETLLSDGDEIIIFPPVAGG